MGQAINAIGASATEAPAEGATNATGTEAGGEDISMEDVLGSGTRKQPAAAKAAPKVDADEVPEVETQTF